VPPPADLGRVWQQAQAALTPAAAERLARRLGLPTAAVGGVGFDPATGDYLFPEFAPDGTLIGLSRRLPDDTKRMVPGSRRGLTLGSGWADHPGPLFLVEGPTDVLALAACGLAAVGRPSYTGGAALLADLLRPHRPDRPLCVVGENDRKPDGGWPGRDGAAATAAALAAGLGRVVEWALPPDGLKDGRAWVTNLLSDGRDPAWVGGHLAAELTRGSVAVEPPPAPARPPGEFPAFVPAGRLAPDAAGVPWLWDGLLARDAVTVLAALPKCGKTTLIQHLLTALPAGGTFAGRRLRPGRACVVSEEAGSVWAMRVRDGLPPDTGVIPRGRLAVPDLATWTRFLLHLRDGFAADPCDLLVFDTLANIWPVKDENNATEVTAALRPLHHLTAGRSVLLVHHLRKSDGAEGTGSRGSGALAGFVDITVELRRAKNDPTGRRRTLTTYGRYDPTLADWTVELTPAGYAHRPADADPAPADGLLRFLPGPGEGGLTAKQVWERMDPGGRPSDPKNLHRSLVATPGVRVDGTGKKGSPFRYSRAD
jgi:hypothetical protein